MAPLSSITAPRCTRTLELFHSQPTDSAPARCVASKRHAGARRARYQPALLVEHVALGHRDAAAALDDAAVRDQPPGPERAQEVDLQLERGERLSRLEGREVRRAHGGVGEVAEDAAVDRAHRVRVPLLRDELHLRLAAIHPDELESD